MGTVRFMAGKQRSDALLTNQLNEYFLDRILPRSVAPTAICPAGILRKTKKDPEFFQKTKAAYEDALSGPFPKGPWPCNKKKFGWVTFTMDDATAARVKLVKYQPLEDDPRPNRDISPFSVDVELNPIDVDLTGHFEQVYVETKNGIKKLVKSSWEAKMQPSEWVDNMYLPYQKNWRQMNKSRAALIKTVQKFQERQAVQSESLVTLATVAASRGNRASRKTTKVRVFLFLCPDLCPKNGVPNAGTNVGNRCASR